MTTKERLLAMLEQNKGAYFSGEELAQRFQVSRAAIWKAIQSLRQEGYAIDAVTNRGYCLSPKGDLLSAQGIEKYLNHPDLRLTVLPSVSSTNTLLRQQADQGAPQGTVVLAGEQTAGRGRMGRSFFSPPDTGLYLSLLLRPDSSQSQQATTLTAAAAVAMCQAMEALTGYRIGIKWVNDLYWNGKKICGILTEGAFSLESGALEYLILGVGVNLCPPKVGFPGELDSIAGSLLVESMDDGKNRLAAEFLNRFWDCYTHPERQDFVDEYRRRSVVLGKPVTVSIGGQTRPAVAEAIDDSCRLVVRCPDGETMALSYGEVSLNAP